MTTFHSLHHHLTEPPHSTCSISGGTLQLPICPLSLCKLNMKRQIACRSRVIAVLLLKACTIYPIVAKLCKFSACRLIECTVRMSLEYPCRGAAEGEGLGNAFLSHIQAVDGIFHVCRGFEDADVTHVEDRVDPVQDLEIIHK